MKNMTHKLSAERWCSKLMEEVLEVFWNMWEHCNHVLHSEENPRHESINECLNKEVDTCFCLFWEEKFLGEDMHLFRQGAEKMREQTVEEKMTWLASVRAAKARKKLCKKDINPLRKDKTSGDSFTHTLNLRWGNTSC